MLAIVFVVSCCLAARLLVRMGWDGQQGRALTNTAAPCPCAHVMDEALSLGSSEVETEINTYELLMVHLSDDALGR